MTASGRAAPAPDPRDADDRALLEDCARAAGEIARRHFGAGPRVWDKGDGQGPVTEADLEIDAYLRTRLLAARPDYGWLSEETADDPVRLSRARVFVVDPIDGTRAFIDGASGFTHALAVVETGRPVAAAVHMPLRDRTWTATAGGGARLNGDAIRATGRATLDGATVLAARPSFDARHWRAGPPPLTRTFRSSLAYRLSLVGQGRFDAMMTLRDCWEWDIAAGALICTEAGAVVTDRAGAPLRFNNPHPKVPGVVAATPAVQAGIRAALAPDTTAPTVHPTVPNR